MYSENEARSYITAMGLTLLNEGLVARTWGNISARISDREFLITPSGLAYDQTKDSDHAIYNLDTDEWSGPHKPSGERGVHAAAYRAFPEAGFVIHTHQVYASALGVAGFDQLNITEEEKERLGGILLSGYGLPGQKKLTNAVKDCLEAGAHVVLMKYHGVLVVGTDQEDAYGKVILLEEICKRNYRGAAMEEQDLPEAVMSDVKVAFPEALPVTTSATIAYSTLGIALKAQLDDMAQMIGGKIPVVSGNAEEIKAALNKNCAVFVANQGAIVNGRDADDSQALQILVDKAAVSALQAIACGKKIKMGCMDVALQNFVYRKKYSKQKFEKG